MLVAPVSFGSGILLIGARFIGANSAHCLITPLPSRVRRSGGPQHYRCIVFLLYPTPQFGPYVSERAWGTVREDYSANGDAWRFFPHEQARSRAYRWSEDGIAGVCNRFQNVVLSLAFWNGRDSLLKERLFGLSGPEGNHGEDVKEIYFYLDST